MRKEERTMKMMKVMNSIMIVALLMTGVVQAQAVDYKSTYKGQNRTIQQTEYKVASTTTAPSATFQSTSTMPVMSVGESMLNEDGSVNAEAYGVGQDGTAQAPGRGHIRKITNPDAEDDDDVENPLGDVFWPLMLLALAYLSLRVLLKRKRA